MDIPDSMSLTRVCHQVFCRLAFLQKFTAGISLVQAPNSLPGEIDEIIEKNNLKKLFDAFNCCTRVR